MVEVTELGTAIPVLDRDDTPVDWLALCEVRDVTEVVAATPGLDEGDTRVDWLAT